MSPDSNALPSVVRLSGVRLHYKKVEALAGKYR